MIHHGWRITFEAPAGTRILSSRGLGITFDGNLWWSRKLRKWVSFDDLRAAKSDGSSGAACRSFKSFLRHLRKHTDVLKGYEITFVNRFVGHDIFATYVGESHNRRA